MIGKMFIGYKPFVADIKNFIRAKYPSIRDKNLANIPYVVSAT